MRFLSVERHRGWERKPESRSSRLESGTWNPPRPIDRRGLASFDVMVGWTAEEPLVSPRQPESPAGSQHPTNGANVVMISGRHADNARVGCAPRWIRAWSGSAQVLLAAVTDMGSRRGKATLKLSQRYVWSLGGGMSRNPAVTWTMCYVEAGWEDEVGQ